ncbi:E3 ubiquitin/ISG15 ligase TRIM25-like [Pyxicephalus adspersus]|uniref:Uncharacterized protein n=1 Tax=Pyxicephalus adspersus TaxID=30357 RepID=A0AAV3AM22_PYXAD|nr:TPA: hypothetical protein GDO54_008140 [Pyxicephalus adspersus]
MASADLGEDLCCSICLEVYTDPVTLKCGHNFCQECIVCVLDTQEKSGVYTCPDCRQKFVDRSALYKNITLRNIAERFLSAQQAEEDSGTFCTYCTDSKVPAIKCCLHCDALLCNIHLTSHSTGPEHTLSEPSACLKTKKCSVHKKTVKYFCTDDSVCICATCLAGQHRGHRAEPIGEALEKKKTILRNILEKLTPKKVEMEKNLQRLQERRTKVQETAASEMKRVTVLLRDIVNQLEDLEMKMLSEISGQEEKILMLVSGQIQLMETKKDELCRNVSFIEELCYKTDPLKTLQQQLTDYSDTEEEGMEDGERNDQQVYYADNLDEDRISKTLLVGLSDIMTIVKGRLHSQEASGLLLDVATAANNVKISDDLKGVILTKQEEDRPETPLRFHKCQVISKQSFCSGRHYWEVLTSESGGWRFGMTYPSAQSKGDKSALGDNDKSWCMRKFYGTHAVRHHGKDLPLAQNISSQKFRVCLDYEAGQLSFYELGDHIRHLYTFTTTFTEPLHAALYVMGSTAWVRITS